MLKASWSSLGEPIDISIPLKFNGPQPNAYGVEPASSAACEYGELVGDTRRGGSCNFEKITLIPHCNGTHTECVGHITNERISIRECLTDVLIPAALISVRPMPASGASEAYSVPYGPSDLLITRHSIETAIASLALADHDTAGLIIRTLPNDKSKLIGQYGDYIPPYFTIEAMEFITAAGFSHLLVDVPSIDRIHDQGKLANHRVFWQVDPGSFETNSRTRRYSTITEMIYVPDEVHDGDYILNLQIAPLESDASPSRPLIFKIKNS